MVFVDKNLNFTREKATRAFSRKILRIPFDSSSINDDNDSVDVQALLYTLSQYSLLTTASCSLLTLYLYTTWVYTVWPAIRYSTVQYSTVQYSTVQYSTVQDSTVQSN